MKLKLTAGLLALALARGIGAAPLALDAPESVTLSVDASESGTLSWEPVDRDDLMGYSVWMRADKGEFTRLIIPTMVGKEMKKLPMTTKSSIILKGLGKRDLELAVVAEYESGRSPKSEAAYSRRARRTAPAPSAAAAQSISPSAAAQEPGAAQAPEEPAAAAPRVARSIMAPPGGIHTSLTGGIWWEQTAARGFNSMGELGYTIVGVPNYDYSTAKNWAITYTRRSIRVPLTLEYGFFRGLEIGGDIAYIQEKAYAGKFDFGDETFQSYQSEAAVEASGFGNPALRVRLQPVQAVPLRFGARAILPTGARSRLQAYGEYIVRASRVAGLDDNAQRMEFQLEFGERGIRPGLNYSLGLSPAASETAVSHDRAGNTFRQRAERGQEAFGEIGYSIPWKAETLPGSLTAGVGLRSIDPSRWFVEDLDFGALLAPDQRAEIRSFTGINLAREDQMVLFLDLSQNIYALRDRKGGVTRAVDSGGRIAFTMKPDGWIFAVSGGFYY